MKAMPVIETPRMKLRPFCGTDLDELARLNANPQVMQYLGSGQPLDRNGSWQQLTMIHGHQQLRGYSLLAVFDRQSGAYLGRTGPWFPIDWPMIEVGWVIDPERQGEGLGEEAGRASLEWCFANLPVDEVCSMIYPGNAASVRVAEKLGAKLARQVTTWGRQADVWVHHRPENIPRPAPSEAPAGGAAEPDTRICSQRFRMRPFRERDLDELTRLYGDAGVMRYVAEGKTLSRGQTWRQIAGYLGHQQLKGFTTLAIEDQRTGVFVGECGLAWREDLPHVEIGWLVDPRRQGQGIATEVARTMLDWAFANFGFEHLCSVIHTENQPSIRVAEKLGARLSDEIDIYGQRQGLWIHDRPASV